MSEIKDGGPAFPATQPFRQGMTLRDYFAITALRALLTAPDGSIAIKGKVPLMAPQGDFAEAAYVIADAMLKAREAKP